MLLSFFLVLLLVSLLAGGLYLLYKDRESWRTRYFDLLESTNQQATSLTNESREREKYLFDEILRAKQIRPVALKDKELPKPQAYTSPEELSTLMDRVSERVEAGVMSEVDASQMLADVRNGKRTQAEVDRDLWNTNLPGSISEF